MKWNRRLQKAFDAAKNKAEKLIHNLPEVSKTLEKAASKISALTGKRIKDAVADLQTLIRMIKAYINGEYKDVPWATAVAILAAIIYFVSPIDLIPDFIPGFGYIDDLAVIAFVLRTFKSDIDRFRRWEEAGASDSPRA